MRSLLLLGLLSVLFVSSANAQLFPNAPWHPRPNPRPDVQPFRPFTPKPDNSVKANQPEFVVQVHASVPNTTVEKILSEDDWGTGTLIDPQHILTVGHAVPLNAKREITVIFKNGDIVAAKMVYISRMYDLAILKLEEVRYEIPVEFGDDLEAGDKVTLHGFPEAKEHRTKAATVKPGFMSWSDDPLVIQAIFEITAVAKDGDSGGPILQIG
jgi:S1-C subfamily serine protease